MSHVPNDTQDLIGTARLRDAIAFKAHDPYMVDGDVLNKLAVLALRLEIYEPFTRDEKTGWTNILREMIHDATV